MESVASLIGTLLFIVLIVALLRAIVRVLVISVPSDSVGIVEKKFFGNTLPEGRVVAMPGEIGIQAKTLAPGIHFFIPFLYKARTEKFLTIPDGTFGIVESIDGNAVPQGRIFAKVTEGHSLFQDGEAFLKAGGEKGPQVQLIPPGQYRINTTLFNITLADNIVIPPGKVGVITAMDGVPLEGGRLLGKSIEGHSNFENGQAFLNNGGQRGPQIDILLPGTYRINSKLFEITIMDATIIPANMVGRTIALDGDTLPEGEYIAKTVSNHNDFQNASAFLSAGGQRGPQYEVLRPGTYYINPLMFRIETDSVTTVERGQVAVLISNVGNKYSLPQTDNHDEQYVVPQGYRGIQREVVGPGSYYFNREATVTHMVQTTNMTVDWDSDKETKFDPIIVISKDGFRLSVSVKVVFCVRPEMAPYMVAKIGSIDNLIINVVHPLIDSSFRNQASSTKAMDFLQDRSNQQAKAEAHTRSELDKYFVETVSVLICGIDLPQDLMDTQTRKIIAEQQTQMYAAQQDAEAARIQMEKKKSEANQQGRLVEAEMNVKIEQENKARRVIQAQTDQETMVLQADGEAKAKLTLASAEAQQIIAVGDAQATAFRHQSEALGSQAVALIQALDRVASGNIKITPDILVSSNQGGNGTQHGLLDVFVAQLMQKQGQQGQAQSSTDTLQP